MTRSKKQEQPEIVAKEFSLEEIDHGIGKLQKRVKAVKELEGLRYDDQRVYNTTDDIRETIRDVFGAKSPEFDRHQYHRIQQGAEFINMSEDQLQQIFEQGILRTITMLERLIERLEEKRADLTSDSTGRIRSAFEQV